MIWPFNQKSARTLRNEYYEREAQKHFEFQMTRIKNMADAAMKEAHPGDSTFPVRSTVVIEYDRLLMIWDIADRMKSEVMVK